MPKYFILCAASLFGVAAYAQGLVALNTLAVDYKVVGPNGTGFGDVPGATAQLYLVTGTALTALYPKAGFYTAPFVPAARYYVQAPLDPVVVPGVAPRGQATLRFRAFAGATYETSMYRGESQDFTLRLGGGNDVATDLEPLTLQILIVPEPSILVLGTLGIATFIFPGRQKEVKS